MGLDLRHVAVVVTCWTLMLCSVFETSYGSKTRHFKWGVEYMFWSPDCKENVVMGINGQFPGPTIRATAGDTIAVELTNKLHTEGVVIHWHGIRQLGTPWADGTASISQCAINPGETFLYRFKVDKVRNRVMFRKKNFDGTVTVNKVTPILLVYFVNVLSALLSLLLALFRYFHKLYLQLINRMTTCICMVSAGRNIFLPWTPWDAKISRAIRISDCGRGRRRERAVPL